MVTAALPSGGRVVHASAASFSDMRPDPITAGPADLILIPFLALVLCVGTTARPEQPAQPQQPSPAVQKLLDQLRSDEWRLRQEAVDKLVAVGEEALPHLQKLVST